MNDLKRLKAAAWRRSCSLVESVTSALLARLPKIKGQPQLEDSLTLRKQLAVEYEQTAFGDWDDLTGALAVELCARPGELTVDEAVRAAWRAGRAFRRGEDKARGGLRVEIKLAAPVRRSDGTLGHEEEHTVYLEAVHLDRRDKRDADSDNPRSRYDRLSYGTVPEILQDPAAALESKQEQDQLTATLDTILAGLTPAQRRAVEVWKGNGDEGDSAQGCSDRAARRASGLTRREQDALRAQLCRALRALGTLEQHLAGVLPAATRGLAPARYAADILDDDYEGEEQAA